MPNEAVVRPASEDILAPLRAQDNVKGSSPFRAVQKSWAYSPSSSISLANDRGTKLGGSRIKFVYVTLIILDESDLIYKQKTLLSIKKNSIYPSLKCNHFSQLPFPENYR